MSLRRVIFLLLRLTGVPFVLREILQRNRVTILCYHDPAPDAFAQHLRWLQRRYSIIPLRRYVEWRKDSSEARLPPKALVITLDDGHRGNMSLEPVLRSLGVPVTIFLCSAIVGTNRHYWWTKVPIHESAALKRVPDQQRRERLAATGHEERREYSTRQALSLEEVAALRPLVDLQAHTRLHPILPMCSLQRAREEIEGCKTDLESRLGLDIYALAYPNGDYSQRDVEITRRAGYWCAVGLGGGYNSATTDLCRLCRIGMADTADLNEVVVKSSGLWDVILAVLGRRQDGRVIEYSSVTKVHA